MNIPSDRKYSRDHEWVKMVDDTTALVGITDFAQEKLGNLVYVTLPVVGDDVIAGENACDVESIKAVSDIVSPVSGVIASAHADAAQLTGWLGQMPSAPGKVFVVHGDMGASDALRQRIERTLHWHAQVPRAGASYTL